ncbi:MAG TPA: HNH endonuclease signature motif containing protein, partial [Thermoanaerobaculia bacterium]|nr:HNH endonuclease signature motif containing protein [Thermoanaerobaculia bacterium]
SILPAAVAAPSEVVRSALRAAVHLMLLDGIVLHLVPESQVNPAERNKLEAGLAFKGPLVDAPELHAQRPRVRVTNSKVETDDRIQFFRSLDERDGSMVLCYTAGLLSTKLPHWTSHLKRLLWLLQRGICPDCQNTISWDEIHVDHLRTRNNGGTSTIINLMLRHPSCNIHKGAKETGWELSPRVFDRFGSPIASQSMLLQQLFDPGLTADRLHQICRSYSRRARL